MTGQLKPADIAVTYLHAWANRDRDTIASYVAEDVVFESPMTQLTGAEPFLAAIDEFAQLVTGVKVISVLGDAERAMIMYDMETAPFGTLRAVEHLEFRSGKISSDMLVFDTYPVRKPSD